MIQLLRCDCVKITFESQINVQLTRKWKIDLNRLLFIFAAYCTVDNIVINC